MFSTRADFPESRSLGLPGAAVLSISSTGELAVSLNRRGVIGYETTGILARVPLAGGAPREILESVQDADWSPDGKSLAVCRVAGSRSRVEYPVGKVIYQTAGWVNGVRISPDGKLLSFVDHAQRGNSDGYLKIIDTTGKLRLAGPFVPGFAGLAWSPKGDEVWWGGILATSIDGKTRTVWASPNGYIQDIARDGSVLLGDGTSRREIVGYAALGAPPRNLTELNWSFPTDISPDGKRVLFTEQNRPPPGVYVRGLDGSPAVRIADGESYGLSPDGRWALTLKTPERRRIVIVPTGAGEPRTLDLGQLTCGWANWFPDGKRALLAASEPGRGSRLYVLDIEGGRSRPITPEGVVISAQSVSPDGRSIFARGPDGRFAIYPSEPGEPRAIPWLEPDEIPLRWTADGGSIYVTRFSEPPGIVDVVDLATGKRSRFTQFDPPDPTGIEVVGPAVIAPDGKSYVYSYRRTLDDLYLATGMR
jgi:dipeptidyl aminopeptidase/acylaminoacyl peptidase